MSLKLKTMGRVVLFAGSASAFATCAAVVLTIATTAPEQQHALAIRAFWTSILIAFPILFYVGCKIKENHALTEELHRLVNRDKLTNLATRDDFFSRLEANPDGFGLSLMVDIDHFKSINDTYGHMVGDQVIARVAKAIQGVARPQDIVCRFGGEEFVVFLSEATLEVGQAMAEQMRQRVEQLDLVEQARKITVTVSIGGSLATQVEEIDLAIHAADAALYRAKRQGRNRVVWAVPEPAETAFAEEEPPARARPVRRDRRA